MRVIGRIGRGAVLLALAGFFTGVSSGMAAPLRVLFLVLVLHVPVPLVGLIEGLAALATCAVLALTASISPREGLRSSLAFLGYLVSNAARPLLALATGWPTALLPVALDHAGKGLRREPLDLLLSESADARPPQSASAHAVYRFLALLGAAAGALITALILFYATSDLRAIVLWSAVPGVLAIVPLMVLLVYLRLKDRGSSTRGESLAATQHSSPGVRFWMFTGISAVAALGGVSSGFLVLRTAGLEPSLPSVALIYFAYSLVRALLVAPLEALAGRWGYLPVMISGLVVSALSLAGWVVAAEAWNAWVLFPMYAVGIGAVGSVGRRIVADIVPGGSLASALGRYHGLMGLALLAANVVGGWLWVIGGPPATFGYAMWATVVALGLMVAWLPWLRRGYAGYDGSWYGAGAHVTGEESPGG